MRCGEPISTSGCFAPAGREPKVQGLRATGCRLRSTLRLAAALSDGRPLIVPDSGQTGDDLAKWTAPTGVEGHLEPGVPPGLGAP
jgi:hypothetical protein